jgi:hypothetical protein
MSGVAEHASLELLLQESELLHEPANASVVLTSAQSAINDFFIIRNSFYLNCKSKKLLLLLKN